MGTIAEQLKHWEVIPEVTLWCALTNYKHARSFLFVRRSKNDAYWDTTKNCAASEFEGSATSTADQNGRPDIHMTLGHDHRLSTSTRNSWAQKGRFTGLLIHLITVDFLFYFTQSPVIPEKTLANDGHFVLPPSTCLTSFRFIFNAYKTVFVTINNKACCKTITRIKSPIDIWVLRIKNSTLFCHFILDMQNAYL